MIRGACPDCGSIRPLPDYLADAEARAALAAALECPAGLARRIIPYLALHAPPAKAIQSGKLARLLRELADALSSGQVTRKGDTRAAPQAIWERALDAVAANAAAGTLRLPLDGHGYLYTIAHDEASRATPAAARPAPGAAAADPAAPGHPSHRPAARDHTSPRPIGQAAAAHLDALREALVRPAGVPPADP